jgi:F0F1-type ATP synthase assembly protein I
MEEHIRQAQLAWRMVIELVAGLGIGFGIGYGLDALLGTRPWLMVVFTLLGFIAGVKTMIRSAEEVQRKQWKRPGREGRRERERAWRQKAPIRRRKTGSGRMVFFVLIAIAVVLFILGLTDSYTQDLAPTFTRWTSSS